MGFDREKQWLGLNEFSHWRHKPNPPELTHGQ